MQPTLKDKAETGAKYWTPRFRSEGFIPGELNWSIRRFNIITVDFVDQFEWLSSIVGLNIIRPKTEPDFMTSELVEKSFTWTLRAYSKGGTMWLEWDTTAPFRAQQGQIHVYSPNSPLPTNPNGKADPWAWDNETQPWNTKLPWIPGRPVAWVAQQSPSGSNVLFLALKTDEAPEVVQKQTFTWKLRAIDVDGIMYLDGDTNAPFRAQQGQVHVYRPDSSFPANPDEQQAWAWDDQVHPWNTNLPWTGTGKRVAWVAQKSPKGPNTFFLTNPKG